MAEPDMDKAQIAEPTPRKPLRLWPGVVAAMLLLLVGFVVPIFVPAVGSNAIIGGLVGALAIIVWWLFFSRALWPERVGAIVLMIAALLATRPLLHKSIATGGQGRLFFISAIPIMSLGLVAWAVASRRLSNGPRRASMVAAILLSCGVWTLFRTDGVTGDYNSDLAWRWTKTAEERLLSQAGNKPLDATRGKPTALPTARVAVEIPDTARTSDEPVMRPSTPATATTSKNRHVAKTSDGPATLSTTAAAAKTEAEWPGFRGPERDGVIRGVRIETNWSVSPPVELWRRSIGPGWSSFAVRGDRFYTQEQRGDEEIVACYNVTTGDPVWAHRDSTRFWESNGGAGPRATPTLSNAYVYTFGATGILNALDAGNGAVVWSRNVASDADKKVPMWGFASSPLVVDNLVIVAAAGKLVAYDVTTGNPRWFGPAGGWGYSSPHLATIDSVAQIVLLNGAGAISVALADGTLLWEHKWPGDGIVQPALTADGEVLIGTGSGLGDNAGIGVRRIAVANGPDGWTVEEGWTTNGLKPYFNDIVVHDGHAFGFDGSILACIDLKDGKRKWKGGRYGHGQLVLLPDQDLLLVLSEQGELALVNAAPDQFTELARFPAIKGKTWNHPVLAGDILLVRNGQEMVAFRLSLARG